MNKLDKIKKEIEKTGYFYKNYIIYGFPKKHKKLYLDIKKITSDLDNTLSVNNTLRARFIFIIKYNCDILKITGQKGVFAFNKKIDDFIDRDVNYTKTGWYKIKENLCKIKDVYDKSTTINLLKNNDFYKSLFGRGKNRFLIKSDPKLYNSIYYHTSSIDDYNISSNSFRIRIIFLIKHLGDYNKILCKKCGKPTSFNFYIKDFTELCINCFNDSKVKYPTVGYFQKKYGDDWKIFYEQDRDKIKSIKVNSKKWFIKKYGDKDGIKEYIKYAEKRIDNLNRLKSKKYSDISQELFWKIYNELSDEEKQLCHFKELNDEIFIKDSDGWFFFPDFVYKNKIIEYDGKYWHKPEKDLIRTSIYSKHKYKQLILNEDDYSRSNKNNNTVNRCLKFLRDED
jgi:hypothetical protein